MCAKTSHARKCLHFLDAQIANGENVLAYSHRRQSVRKENCIAIFLCDAFHITEQLRCEVSSLRGRVPPKGGEANPPKGRERLANLIKKRRWQLCA